MKDDSRFIKFIPQGSRFEVHFLPNPILDQQIKTIPGRRFDPDLGVWFIRGTAARHLLPFAVENGFDFPPELERAAADFANYDDLTILPVVPNCIDLNGETIVIRTAEQMNYNVREILRRMVGTKIRGRETVQGYGWNKREGFWEFPVGLVRSRANDIKKLSVDYMFMITPAANQIIKGVRNGQ